MTMDDIHAYQNRNTQSTVFYCHFLSFTGFSSTSDTKNTSYLTIFHLGLYILTDYFARNRSSGCDEIELTYFFIYCHSGHQIGHS